MNEQWVSKGMLWRTWFPNGFLMGPDSTPKHLFWKLVLLQGSTYLFEALSWKCILFETLFWVGVWWKIVFQKFPFLCCFFIIIDFLYLTLWRPNLKVVGNLSTLVHRQGKLKNFINFKILVSDMDAKRRSFKTVSHKRLADNKQ